MERFNFFKNIENRYKNKISLKKPLVLRLDGKGVTKNPNIDLTDDNEGSFSYALQKTGKYISNKYRCITYMSNDELSIVFEKPIIIKKMLKTTDIQKINSLLSQEIFYIFNKYILTETEPIYFDCRCFNIPENKVMSYLKYRYKSSYNTSIQYFAKRSVSTEKRHGVELVKIIENLESEVPTFKERSSYQREGAIYIGGVEKIPSSFLD